MPTRARRVSKQVARMQRSEIRVGAAPVTRIPRSLSSGRASRGPVGAPWAGALPIARWPTPDLFLVFRLFLGWGEPFKPLEQLLLGHAIARDLCIVGVHGASAGADEWRRFRLRFVNFDVFLQ